MLALHVTSSASKATSESATRAETTNVHNTRSHKQSSTRPSAPPIVTLRVHSSPLHSENTTKNGSSTMLSNVSCNPQPSQVNKSIQHSQLTTATAPRTRDTEQHSPSVTQSWHTFCCSIIIASYAIAALCIIIAICLIRSFVLNVINRTSATHSTVEAPTNTYAI